MKRCLCFVMMVFLFTMLSAQQAYWHVYQPGGFVQDICCFNSEVWVASGAGIMRWNPTTNERTQYDQYTTPFPCSSIRTFCISSQGELWAGGYNGVMRFDGVNWQLVNAISVRKMAADANGGIWAGTENGVYHYVNGNWVTFNSSNSTLPQSFTIHDMAVDPQQGLWIGTYGGVYYYNGSVWTNHTAQNSTLPSNEVYSISFESNGQGWFGTPRGVAKYNNGVWQLYTILGGAAITDMRGSFIDAWQRIWLWSNNKLWMYDGVSWQIYPIALFGDYSMSYLRMAVDEEQVAWLGLSDSYSPLSVVRFDGTNFSKHHLCEFPLPSPNVQAIFRGFDGKIWIGTAKSDDIGGYLSIGDDGFKTYGMYNTDMPCDHVWALAQDNHLNTWVGTCIGLLKTGPTGSHVFTSAEIGFTNTYIHTICPVGDDGVWIGSTYGVSRYADGIWTVLSSAEAGMNLANTNVIKADDSGRIWIGCAAGVCCYDNSQFIIYPQATHATDFAFGTQGELWVARGELSRLYNGQWTHYNATNSGLTANYANCLAIDHNQLLWIGTAQPDCKLHSFDGLNWNSYDEYNSALSGYSLKKIFVDEDNTKWIGGKFLYLFNENGLPVSNDEQFAAPAVESANYPNPFKESTTIRFDKKTAGHSQINIFNLKGQLLWTHKSMQLAKGETTILWDGKDKNGNNCASGLYLIQVQDEEGSNVHKALKVK